VLFSDTMYILCKCAASYEWLQKAKKLLTWCLISSSSARVSPNWQTSLTPRDANILKRHMTYCLLCDEPTSGDQWGSDVSMSGKSCRWILRDQRLWNVSWYFAIPHAQQSTSGEISSVWIFSILSAICFAQSTFVKAPSSLYQTWFRTTVALKYAQKDKC